MSSPLGRLLIVDDDGAMRTALSRAIRVRLKSVIVDTADSAEDALKHARAIRYDTVVSDYRMPGMDGRAFLAEVNRIRPRTPGILVSGHFEAVPTDPQQSFVFVPKPLDRDQFFEVVQRAIAMSHRLRHAGERWAQLRARARELRRQHVALMAARRNGQRTAAAIIATEPDGTIVHWSHGAKALYGWRAEEVIGRNVLAVTPTAVSAREAASIMETLRSGRAWSGRFPVQRRDGTEFIAHVYDTPLIDPRAGLVGIVGLSCAESFDLVTS